MKIEETIKDFNNRIIGYVETDTVTGNKTGRNFLRIIVGYYDNNLHVTRDFSRKIVAKGDTLSSLIAKSNKK